ncbi:hypothetical protein ISF62_18175 [Burkholderia pseudomallei]|nr:hypothetical protein [Burkholderia pseudomallei]
MIVALDTLTVAPDVIEVVPMMISVPDVPTLKSAMNVPPDVVSRAHTAVPVAAAVAFAIEFNVSTPPDEAGANVALQVSCASNVLPLSAPPVAGRVPE